MLNGFPLKRTGLKDEPDYSKRLFVEGWFVNSKSNVIHRNDCNSFPLAYKKLLDYNLRFYFVSLSS